MEQNPKEARMDQLYQLIADINDPEDIRALNRSVAIYKGRHCCQLGFPGSAAGTV